MNHTSRFSTILAVVAALFILAGSASGYVLASNPTPPVVDETLVNFAPGAPAAAGEAPRVPGGPGFVMVPGWAFLPNVPSSTTNNFSYGSMSTEAATNANFHASFSLPNNVTISKITLYFTDNDANPGKYVAVALRTFNFCTLVQNQVARAASDTLDAQPALRSTSTVVSPALVVDQSCATYTLIAYLPDGLDLWLHGVRVDYGNHQPALYREVNAFGQSVCLARHRV